MRSAASLQLGDGGRLGRSALRSKEILLKGRSALRPKEILLWILSPARSLECQTRTSAAPSHPELRPESPPQSPPAALRARTARFPAVDCGIQSKLLRVRDVSSLSRADFHQLQCIRKPPVGSGHPCRTQPAGLGTHLDPRRSLCSALETLDSRRGARSAAALSRLVRLADAQGGAAAQTGRWVRRSCARLEGGEESDYEGRGGEDSCEG